MPWVGRNTLHERVEFGSGALKDLCEVVDRVDEAACNSVLLIVRTRPKQDTVDLDPCRVSGELGGTHIEKALEQISVQVRRKNTVLHS